MNAESGPKAAPQVLAAKREREHSNPIHISESLMELLLGLFSYDELLHLTAIKREREPYIVARRRLSSASREELAGMIVASKTPSIGWWQRAMRRAS